MSTWMRGMCRRHHSEQSSSRRTSMFSKNKSLSPTLPPEVRFYLWTHVNQVLTKLNNFDRKFVFAHQDIEPRTSKFQYSQCRYTYWDFPVVVNVCIHYFNDCNNKTRDISNGTLKEANSLPQSTLHLYQQKQVCDDVIDWCVMCLIIMIMTILKKKISFSDNIDQLENKN